MENRRQDTQYDAFLDYLREHRLPCLLEVVLSWVVSLAILLYYGFMYYRSDYCRHTNSPQDNNNNNDNHPRALTLLPLMTESKSSSNNSTAPNKKTPQDLHQELLQALQILSRYDSSWKSKQLVTLIRSNVKLRRLASQFVMSVQRQQQNDAKQNSPLSPSVLELYHQLEDVWWDLLRLPNLETHDGRANYLYEISLVVPAYRENPATVLATLQAALDTCHRPKNVQVVVVNAGECHGLSERLQQETDTTWKYEWSEVKLVHYNSSTTNNNNNQNHSNGSTTNTTTTTTPGRGPTLNFGAACSNGRLLLFLHSDCRLPENWDRRIQKVLRIDNNRQRGGRVAAAAAAAAAAGQQQQQAVQQQVQVHACAFRMGVDTSGLVFNNGLRRRWNNHNDNNDNNNENDNSSYPWGIRAVQFLANVRTSYFQMPYGDQAISMPACHFGYIGGFPHQPVMEDYALMDFLRRRAAMLPERLAVLAGPPCRCSPRRWQRVGVLYMTLANALLVHRYTHEGWTAEEVFEYYYRRPVRQKNENNNDKKKHN